MINMDLKFMRSPHLTTLSLVHIISGHQRDNLNVLFLKLVMKLIMTWNLNKGI